MKRYRSPFRGIFPIDEVRRETLLWKPEQQTNGFP
jgi:hypothetical protein